MATCVGVQRPEPSVTPEQASILMQVRGLECAGREGVLPYAYTLGAPGSAIEATRQLAESGLVTLAEGEPVQSGSRNGQASTVVPLSIRLTEAGRPTADALLLERATEALLRTLGNPEIASVTVTESGDLWETAAEPRAAQQLADDGLVTYALNKRPLADGVATYIASRTVCSATLTLTEAGRAVVERLAERDAEAAAQAEAERAAALEAAIASPAFSHCRCRRMCGQWLGYVYHRDPASPSGVMLAAAGEEAEVAALLAKHRRSAPLSPTEGLARP